MSSSMDIDSDSNNQAFVLPWVEKYRPEYLKDIVGNEEAIERLKLIGRDGTLPNLILTGLPGIGKTTSILCLAHEILGSVYKEAVLELNASDDRGIDVVRSKIKAFAQKKVTLPPGKQKIVILDEADSMTTGAQQALRRTMEIFSNTTRFALACNQSSKIIEPIQSRCAVLRFRKLTDNEIMHRLQEICHSENVKVDDSGIEALIFSADGDMRQAINNLQSAYFGFGYINADHVFKVCDQPHPVAIQSILSNCIKGHIDEAAECIRALYDTGYSTLDIINTVSRVTNNYDDIDEAVRSDFISEIGETHTRILDGHNSVIQLTGLVSRLCRVAQQ